MHIRNSIMAGEILVLLENISCSLRINDIEIIMQTRRVDTYSAIARLLSEGLIDLIKEGDRTSIALTEIDEVRESSYLESDITEHLVAVG